MAEPMSFASISAILAAGSWNDAAMVNGTWCTPVHRSPSSVTP